ncbi:hypothetical protein [Streptomyces sasae]|uniref:hypothetical protein n=1 Tax=Streptomyces sasae TaxID=1266772 RepID=UPI00292F32FE|nr:hypothetical protein [Streptomyces sasae]
MTFERVLDGLVRHARLDRGAPAHALKPVMRRQPRSDMDCTQSDVYDVTAALRGDEPRELHFTVRLKYRSVSPAGELLKARLAEATDINETHAQPFLLAVPTDSTGALDAAVLVQWISVLDGHGVTPAPVDLAQALLRVSPTADEKVLGAAGRLGSDAGQRVARWLREGGLPHWGCGPPDWSDAHSHRRPTEWLSHVRPEPAPGPLLLPAAATRIAPRQDHGLSDPMVPFWLAQLPHHRHVVLARDQPPARMAPAMRATAGKDVLVVPDPQFDEGPMPEVGHRREQHPRGIVTRIVRHGPSLSRTWDVRRRAMRSPRKSRRPESASSI